MKKILGLVVAVVAVAFATSARAQFTNFNAGDIVIYRIGGDAGTLDDPCNGGSGSGCLTNTGNAVFLDEYTTNGTYVQTLPLPTNYFGGYSPVLADGLAASEGVVTRSVDGRFLLVTGYGATIGQYTNASISGEAAAAVPRVVATVDQFGHINSTTTQTNSLLSTEDIRCAVSTDGTNLWIAGASGSPIYTTRGSFLGTQLDTNPSPPVVVNMRVLNIFSNQLYFSDASESIREGVMGDGFSSSTGTDALPTVASGTTQTNLPGTPTSGGSPYGVVFFNLGDHNPGGPDTLYVADDGVNGGGGITKYSYSSGTWSNVGGLLATGAGVRFLTGTSDASGNVYLYIAETPAFVAGSGYYPGGGTLFHYIDSAGYNQPPTDNNSDLADSSVWEVGSELDQTFAGVAFAPVGGEAFPSQPGYLSVGPITGFFEDELGCGPFINDMQTFSVANPGNSAITWSASVYDTNGFPVSWVNLSQSGSTLQETQSTTVVATFNNSGNVLTNTYPGPVTNIADIVFSSSSGIVTEEVRLILDAQRVLPGTSFSSSGAPPSSPGGPAGPFSPLSQVYTITNNDCGGINWSVNLSTSSNIFTLSATSGSLAAGAGTNITVSVNNAVDTNLAIGTYSDIVTFSNVSAGTQIATRALTLSIGDSFFFDDFSTYIQNQNLVGQYGWQQDAAGGTGGVLVVQNNAVVIPGNEIATGQWAFKNFPVTTNPPVYAGMLMSFTSVTSTTNSGPGWTVSMDEFNNGTISAGFTLYELAAGCPSTGQTNFFYLGGHTSQQSGTPLVYAPSTYPTGTLMRVIIASDINGSNTTLYVNPTSSSSNQTPTVVCHPNSNGFGLDLGVGGFNIRVYDFADSPSAGALIYKVACSTNFAAVYNWITPAPPFEITSISRSGSNVVVVWNGQVGTNVVQVSQGTADGSFTTNSFTGVSTDVLTSAVSTNYTDVGGGTNKPTRYYRIQLLQ